MSHASTTSVGRKPSDTLSHIIIWAIFAIELLPFYMMLQMSVKTNTSFMTNPWLPAPPADWQWSNFSYGLGLIGPYIANTVFVATLGTAASLFLAICAAYFFARYRMPGSDILFAMFMFLMLMPGVANIVPLFTLLKSMNLLNTLWALIIVGIAGGQVFAIFVLKNFIEEIPKDLFEAAEIDGASHFQQMRNVVIPMSAPIIGTLAILMFLGKWNDFMLPLIVMRDKELFTLGVGLIYLNGEYVKQWGRIMAAFLIASMPLIIMFLFTMKLFVRGLSGGAVKG
ncbi:carbohydrate ABC transporter permease [Verrucomicrobia bacterium LW23]|nr:carbohydrate ABC transporter permease [Verrucomicrobia bacterium LW23]